MHPKQKFHTMPTHWRTHPDEYAGIYCAQRFGEKFFSDNLTVEFYDAGIKTPDGKPVEEYLAKGFFPIGIWGSCDEHRAGGRPRKYNECAATFMAKFLGVSGDPKLMPILQYVLACDTGKAKITPNDDLSIATNTLHWMYPTDPYKIMNWFFQALDAKYGDDMEPGNFSLKHIRNRIDFLGNKEGAKDWYEFAKNAMKVQQRHLVGVTSAEFYLNGKVHTVSGPHRNLSIAVVLSDDELISRYAFSNAGGRCDVLIQQKKRGNVQIFSNKHLGIYLDNVAPIIRKLAMEASGRWSRNLSHEYLSREGSEIFGAEEFCFMHGHLLLNGSNTAPHTKPTKIPLDKIFDGVCKGLAMKRPQKRPEKMAE